MKALRENDQIVLRLAPSEAQFLRRIFAGIIRQYLLKPDEVHPSVADVWYSKRGCLSAGLNEEQTREWIENLHHLKSANVAALRRWRRSIASRDETVVTLTLGDEESQAFAEFIAVRIEQTSVALEAVVDEHFAARVGEDRRPHCERLERQQ